jgi:peptidoglycan/xylan/chitin deacetylase (PgdA/CDA1 family)
MMRKPIAMLLLIFMAFAAMAGPLSADTRASAEGGGKMIALTFDDGPHPGNTGRILDVLKKYQVWATFFVLGCNAELYPEPLLRAVDEGHEIENHSYDHKTKGKSTRQLISGIDRTSRIIESMTGRRPSFFRPPEGRCPPEMKSALDFLGYEPIYWTIDSEDWTGKASDEIVSAVLRAVRGNDVILFHDYTCPNQNTMQALDLLIPALQSRGYRFVTLSEMKRGHVHSEPIIKK